MLRKHIAGWILGALSLLVTGAAVFGLSTRHARLNLGPGDSPFVNGFEENSDVEEKVGWHWTTYDAAIDLPLRASQSPIDATLRYARVFGEEAVVDVRVGGVNTEPFRARGGEIQTTIVRARGVDGPLRLSIKVDSHERRNMGLRMDGISIDVPSGAPLRLTAGAACRPVVTIALLFGGLFILGGSPFVAGVLSVATSMAFFAAAWTDLFDAWRLTSAAPLMLVLSSAVLWAGKKALTRFSSMEESAAALISSAALFTMLFRLALISHPDFYYPDLLTHTRVAQAIQTEGPSFFLHPADALSEQKAWTKPVLGSVSALPYAVVFHTPFAVLASAFALNADQVETAMKAASALVSVLPILLMAAFAARLSLPPLAALMLCLIPTYASRLGFALMPALFGHVFDLAVILALSRLVEDDRAGKRAVAWVFACLLAGHLAYTSSVVNEGVLVVVVIAMLLAAGRAGRSMAFHVFVAEAAAALLAFGLYYRHFVGDVFGLAARLVGAVSDQGTPTPSIYPVESFWSVLLERTNTFFGWSFVALALLGLAMAGAKANRATLVRAWFVAYLVLIFLRAKIPDVFRYGHETLFLTPLIAVLAGCGLVFAWRRGGLFWLSSVAAGIAVVTVSLIEQIRAVAAQLRNAL